MRSGDGLSTTRPRRWYMVVYSRILVQTRFCWSFGMTSLFHRQLSPRVDDSSRRRALSEGLQHRFPHGITITDDSTTVYHLLGCVVERPSPDLIRIHQKPFIDQLLRKAGFEDGKRNIDEVPVAPSTRFSKIDCVERLQGDKDHRWYRSVTMSMNHAQNWTRPDLTYLVTKMAKYMQAPGEAHLKLLKKGLRYLRGRTDLALVYDFRNRPRRTGLYGFFDASHADDVDSN